MKDKKTNGLKEVAKEANVALATVDRVIHNRIGVSERTREKVLKTIEKLDYQPNIMASNLSKKKTFVFGVFLPKKSLESTYWNFPLVGIDTAIKELEHYSIEKKEFLYDQNNDDDIRKQILKLINNKIDGLILTSKFSRETAILIQDCNEKKIPYIFIDSNEDEKKSVCTIQQPLYESGQLAAQLFSFCFQKGEIITLYIKDIMDSKTFINEKLKGLNDFFKESFPQINTKEKLISTLNKNEVYQELDSIFTNNNKIKGIFIPNSKVSYIASYLTEKKINNIRLIGYDYLPENDSYLESGIIDFLICQRPKEQGYKAIVKLFELIILRKKIETKIVMPLDIVTQKNYKYYL